jgi:hypothetical protein
MSARSPRSADAFDSEGRALKVGDRIVPGANVTCGACHFCRNGYPYYLCEHMEDYGNSLHCGRAPFLFGGWAEYMYLLPNTPIFRVPDDLPDEVAVLTEIMAVTHGVETAHTLLGLTGGYRFANSVAVLGTGPLGPRRDPARDCSVRDHRSDRSVSAPGVARDLGVVDDARGRNRTGGTHRAGTATGGLGPDVCSITAVFRDSSKRCAWFAGDRGRGGVRRWSVIISRHLHTNVSVIGVGGDRHIARPCG